MNREIEYGGSELYLFSKASNWKRYIAESLAPFVSGRVLEVGAGIGSNTREFHSVGASEHIESWLCLEPDPMLAAKISSSIEGGELPGKYSAETGTIGDLPEDRQFESILYIDVLEHIDDDRAELVHAASRLAEGGYLCVLAPAHQWLFSELDRSHGHFRRYTRSTLNSLDPPDVNRVLWRYLDSVGLIASMANRAILHKDVPTEKQIIFWDRVMVRLSRLIDPIFFSKLGKSIVMVWRKDN